ncbi:hypothetical protein D9M68_924610 [compost metagenome]
MGSDPVVITSRCPSTPVWTAFWNSMEPRISSDRPPRRFSPNMAATLLRRRSASISSTRRPVEASTAARLADTKVLPAPGVALEIMTRLFDALGMANFSAVRSRRNPSSAGSFGCCAASRCTPGLPWRMARSSSGWCALSVTVL